MSPADHQLVTQAVARAEEGTDGEIVTIVAERSDSYHDSAEQWAAGIAFAFLSSFAIVPGFYLATLDRLSGGWEHDYSVGELMGLVFVATLAVFLIARFALNHMPLRLAMTPASTKERRARRRAIMLFRVGAERRTTARTGILIYLSLGEHRAEIVADEAIAEAVAPEIWGDAMIALIDEVRAGRPGEGMAAAVAHVGRVLTEAFPKSDDNPNELPDRLIEI